MAKIKLNRTAVDAAQPRAQAVERRDTVWCVVGNRTATRVIYLMTKSCFDSQCVHRIERYACNCLERRLQQAVEQAVATHHLLGIL